MIEGAIILLLGILVGFSVGYFSRKQDRILEKAKGYFAKKATIVDMEDPLDKVDI